jgi:predicted secreted Zn-dependent protease
MVGASAAGILVGWMACCGALAEPVLKVGLRFYEVTGNSATGLRAQLDRLGPVSKSGRRFDGRTDWEVRWNYSYLDSAGGCRIDGVTLAVNVVFTLPRWSTAMAAPPVLRQRWGAYLEALQQHEDGHRDIALAAAREIELEIRALSQNRLPCAALPATIDALGRRILGKHQSADDEYDARTRHGAVQGAVFP